MPEWKPIQGEIFRFEKEGDTIEGELIGTRDGQFFRQDGTKSKVFDIKTSHGVKSIFSTMIMERQMASVKTGTMVKIVYKGNAKTKGGRLAKNFEVFTSDK